LFIELNGKLWVYGDLFKGHVFKALGSFQNAYVTTRCLWPRNRYVVFLTMHLQCSCVGCLMGRSGARALLLAILSTFASRRRNSWLVVWFYDTALTIEVIRASEIWYCHMYGGTCDENNGFWFGCLDLLALRLHSLPYTHLIQRYRWFTHFTVHRCTRIRILSFHQPSPSNGSQHRN
jgi:hypothetical protein